MPRKEIGNFKVERLEILSEDGSVDEELFEQTGLKDEDIIEMYKLMVLSREYDSKALKLQRQGRLGTYASGEGQEAAHVASSYPLIEDDWMVIAFREDASCITRGESMVNLLQYWGGDERGDHFEGNTMPVAIPVGSQPLHGSGIGWGLKLKGKKAAALTYFGDGATSEGDFHEAMNFAGVYNANTVFCCQNNKYAISLPVERQTKAESMAQKAIAYGFEGIQVDGNDAFAVYLATKNALEKARNGEGPTLVECDTYRMGDHTTADEASRYRSEEELKKWKEKDPVERLRKFMINRDVWDDEKEKELKEEVKEKVAQAVEEYENLDPAEPTDMMKYLYAEMTPQLKRQAKELEEYVDHSEHKHEVAAEGETGAHKEESEEENHIEESPEGSQEESDDEETEEDSTEIKDEETNEDVSVSDEESKGE